MTNPDHQALLSADELAEALSDLQLRILDASTSLVLDEAAGRYVAAPMREAYEQAHLPGALSAPARGSISPFQMLSTSLGRPLASG